MPGTSQENGKHDLQAVNDYIHRQIPLTKAAGIRISAYMDGALTLAAPLKPNLNHRHTAFGGSLSVMGILSGWALIFLRLREAGITARLVIQKSHTDFDRPVTSDFSAMCPAPDERTWSRFIKTLLRHKRARITLSSELRMNGDTAGCHHGTYVAMIIDGTNGEN